MMAAPKNRIRPWSAWWLAAALLFTLLSSQARAADQPTASSAARLPEDPFAALHARLDEKADEALQRAGHSEAPSAEAPDQASMAPAADPAALRQFAHRYWSGQERDLRRAVERVEALRPTLEPILREEGLSPELLGVMLVESGGHPRALSPQGARGLWQFMPATARRYRLQVAPGLDERLDAEKSTRAAARHLRDLEEQFGSWALALAAYNAGGRAVERAVRRAGSRDFGTLSQLRLLPDETRAYVPAVLAAAPLFGGSRLGKAKPPSGGDRIVYATADGPRADVP